MIVCKKCGCENPAYELVCNECAFEFNPTQSEIDRLISDAAGSMKSKDYRTAVDIYRFLAGNGVTEGERELALILERGLLLPRDTEMAEKYFYAAAKKGDPTAAYRYSRIIGRRDFEAAQFWLEYSAITGCKDSYESAAKAYSARGDEESAVYYYSLSALEGNTKSVFEMANRHFYGRGVTQNECYAKWYLNQMSRIPLYALSLRRRLASVDRSYTPPTPRYKNKNEIIRRLIAKARKYELRKVLVRLAEIFVGSDSCDAKATLGYLYVEGIEFEQNIEQGITMLRQAAESGSALGAKYLGDMYAEGEYTEKNPRLSVKYYRLAADLGCDGAYEAIGDVFNDGILTPREPLMAISLYEIGEANGDSACSQKLKKIKDERHKNYMRGCEIEEKSPEEAFILFKKAVDSGYIPAHAKIAPYYEKDSNNRVSRSLAFMHYKAAADSHDERAYEGLGRCYGRGIGTAFNFRLATRYLTMAKNDGSASADRELLRLYENKKRHMTRSLFSTAMSIYHSGRIEQARELIEICASYGLPEAIYSLGCLKEFGITMPSDRDAAVKLYSRANALGYKDKRGAQKLWLLKTTKTPMLK